MAVSANEATFEAMSAITFEILVCAKLHRQGFTCARLFARNRKIRYNNLTGRAPEKCRLRNSPVSTKSVAMAPFIDTRSLPFRPSARCLEPY